MPTDRANPSAIERITEVIGADGKGVAAPCAIDGCALMTGQAKHVRDIPSSITDTGWSDFDARYKKACESSQPDDWMQAALAAQRVRFDTRPTTAPSTLVASSKCPICGHAEPHGHIEETLSNFPLVDGMQEHFEDEAREFMLRADFDGQRQGWLWADGADVARRYENTDAYSWAHKSGRYHYHWPFVQLMWSYWQLAWRSAVRHLLNTKSYPSAVAVKLIEEGKRLERDNPSAMERRDG